MIREAQEAVDPKPGSNVHIPVLGCSFLMSCAVRSGLSEVMASGRAGAAQLRHRHQLRTRKVAPEASCSTGSSIIRPSGIVTCATRGPPSCDSALPFASVMAFYDVAASIVHCADMAGGGGGGW